LSTKTVPRITDGDFPSLNSSSWSFLLQYGRLIPWLFSHLTIVQQGFKDVAGEHKAIFELADGMRAQLKPLGYTQQNLIVTEQQLRRRIKEDLNGGSIGYRPQLLEEKIPRNVDSVYGWKTWLTPEYRWGFAFLTTGTAAIGLLKTSVLVQEPVVILFAVVFLSISISLLLTVSIGSNDGSKAILFVWSTIILSCTGLSISYKWWT
jgi:hypothetical protein